MSIVDRRSIACVLADPVVVMAMGANPGRSGAGDCTPSMTSILTPLLGWLTRVTVVCRSPVDVAVEVYDGYRARVQSRQVVMAPREVVKRRWRPRLGIK